MRHGYVYSITNLITDKVYVGQTIDTIEGRWNRHVRQARNGSNWYIHRAIRKYGISNFAIEILWLGPVGQLNRQEMCFIKLWHSNETQLGYNLTAGGGGSRGFKHTSQAKRKMRGKRKPLSVEHRRRISDALKNKPRKSLSKRHRSNISRALKARNIHPPSQTGVRPSAKTRDRMSASQLVAWKRRKSIDG